MDEQLHEAWNGEEYNWLRRKVKNVLYKFRFIENPFCCEINWRNTCEMETAVSIVFGDNFFSHIFRNPLGIKFKVHQEIIQELLKILCN